MSNNLFTVTEFAFKARNILYRTNTPRVDLRKQEMAAEYVKLLKELRVKHVFMLNFDHEAEYYCSLPSLSTFYKENGFKLTHSPIVDFSAPDKQQADDIISKLTGAMNGEEEDKEPNGVWIHCSAGIGRTG